MDVNSHLFPEGNREWVAKHDKPANPSVSRAESASQLQPEEVVEVRRAKGWICLVAVKRTKFDPRSPRASAG